MAGTSEQAGSKPPLSERQQLVLRAVVTAYLGEGLPIGSPMLAHLVPVPLSSASIRNTLAELTDLGLIDQPHRSAGRVPTERGLRIFVDHLLEPREPADYDVRVFAGAVGETGADHVMHVASRVLSERTRQLGFALLPRLEEVVLRHLSLVRLSAERVLVVVVSQDGAAHRVVIEDDRIGQQAELDRLAAAINERVAGLTLGEARQRLASEARALRSHADRLVRRAMELATRALAFSQDDHGDLVIATRLALLDQPEFRNPERLRQLLGALETKERLVAVLDELLEQPGVSVAFGEELAEPCLTHMALVASPYGGAGAPQGLVGVLGPTRMDYARIIPLVAYLSRLVTEKLNT